MSKNMLIDSAHAEEVRVAVVDNGKLDRFDFDTPSKNLVKGNIYLAKIIRVEPSLQAAFVNYGGNRHGFLSFSEIHHDYFQIPVDDRKQLETHIHNAIAARAAELGETEEELDEKEISRLRYQFYRRYKIQEVIKKRQVVLVQVTKEERGNKGAALTTYISLAGRYCVLMPNTAKGSGVSRKIVNRNDRMKLKKVVADLHIENGSVVIRTAGVGHTKSEIKKDFDYLVNQWQEIKETTVKSTAPSIIYEEASIIKRAIRDMYSRDIDAIYVEGAEAYKTAKDFVKKLMPSHAKKVKQYTEDQPLFTKFKVNDQINQIYSPRVDLPSGGYLVINTTEALISIDVNSGKATRERNIAGTALKTNLEAAAEIARQCRLRDLAGLVVVDFIDMEEKRNNVQVERCLRDALRADKAKIQVGTISGFGLLELSRQRLRSSIADVNMVMCPHCNGTGFMRSKESIAIQVLRRIEEVSFAIQAKEIRVTLSADVALYILNKKRSFISGIEERSGSKVTFNVDSSLIMSDFKIEQIMAPVTYITDEDDETEPMSDALEEQKQQQRNRRQKKNVRNNNRPQQAEQLDEADQQITTTDNAPERKRKKTRRPIRSKQQESKESTDNVTDVINQQQKTVSDDNRQNDTEKDSSKAPESKVIRVRVKKNNRGRPPKKDRNSNQTAAADVSETSSRKSDDAKISTVPIDGIPSITLPPMQQTIARNVANTIQGVNIVEEISNAIPATKKKNGWWQKLLKKPEGE